MGVKPYRLIEGDASTGLLILCDHAENTIPEAYGTLGLKGQDLHRHIAYDLGAAAVAERLATLLGAPAILSRFSRLLIDPNRGLDDPTLIMQISDGLLVPGNIGLAPAEIDARIAGYYEPYHQAIERAVEAAIAAGTPPVIVSVHSFTQALKGTCRGPGRSGCCGTRTRGLRCLCSQRSGPFPISRSATMCPIPGSSRAIRCTATARYEAWPMP